MLPFSALLFIIAVIGGLSNPLAPRKLFEQTPNWVKLEESSATVVSQTPWSSEKQSNGMTLEGSFITITSSITVSRQFLDKWNIKVIGVQVVPEYAGNAKDLGPEVHAALHTSWVRFRDTDAFINDALVTIPPYNTQICNYHPPKFRLWPDAIRHIIGEETYGVHATMWLNVDMSVNPFIKPEDEMTAYTTQDLNMLFEDITQQEWALFQSRIKLNMTLWTDVTSCSCDCRFGDLKTALSVRDHHRRLHDY